VICFLLVFAKYFVDLLEDLTFLPHCVAMSLQVYRLPTLGGVDFHKLHFTSPKFLI
jgi:hypothetical protein